MGCFNGVFSAEDQKERERELVTAEMIPTQATKLTFWNKFFELQYKMMFSGTESVMNHMYSSEPLEWPLMSRGIAYWVASDSNVSFLFISIPKNHFSVFYSGSNPPARKSSNLVLGHVQPLPLLPPLNVLPPAPAQTVFRHQRASVAEVSLHW